MSRREFTKPTKREALKRSGMLCEAIGEWYGLEPGHRCNAPLSHGVEFDHIDLDANSKDNSLANCAAVCPACHSYKTRFHDTPLAAKTLRQQDKALGIKRHRSTFATSRSGPFKQKIGGQIVPRSLRRTRHG